MLPISLCLSALLLLIAPTTQEAQGARPALPAMGTASQQAPAEHDLRLRATQALQSGDHAEAVRLLSLLAQQSPRDAHIVYDLGFAEDALNHTAEAEQSYEKSVELDPTLAEAQVALGLLQAREHKPADARAHLRAAAGMAAAPAELRARALRALAELEVAGGPAADTAAAREDLLAAIKLTEEQPADALLTAQIAERTGDDRAAENAYRRALASTPGEPDAVSGLAHALARNGNRAEALRILEDARRTHPEDPRILAPLAALYAAQGVEGAAKAVNLLTTLRASSPALTADPSLSRQLARLELASGNTAEAERLDHELTTASPDNGQLLDDLGSVYVQQQRFAEAEATLARAVQLRGSFPSAQDWAEAAGHLAFAASRNHDPMGALQALSARATVLPNSAASLFLEAISHDELRQNREALRAYKAFLTMAAGKLPDQEFQARHRITALEHLH